MLRSVETRNHYLYAVAWASPRVKVIRRFSWQLISPSARLCAWRFVLALSCTCFGNKSDVVTPIAGAADRDRQAITFMF